MSAFKRKEDTREGFLLLAGAAELVKLTWPLVLVTVISAFGSSFQYGYNVRVLNHPAVLIQYFYNVTYHQRTQINIDESLLNFLWDFMISFFPVGGLVGSLLTGPLADSYGRKITVLGTSILSVISAILMSLSKSAHSYELTFVARVVIGLCAGISSSVVPMYLAEMAPPNLRGGIVTVSHLFFAVGVLLAQIFGMNQVLGTYKGWPILLGLTGIPAFIQILVLPSYPESPRFLLIQEKNEMAAREALQILRGQDDVEEEMEDLRQEDLAEAREKNMNIFKILYFPAMRQQVLSICVLILGQQLSGINVVHFYLESIYLSTSIEEAYVPYFSIVVTTALLLVTLGTILLADSLGRRYLLLIGFGTCSITCIFLTMSLDLQCYIPWMTYLSTAFVIVFLIGHTIGPATIPSLVIAELFLQSSRSTAYVIGGTLHWLCNFIMVMVFFHVQKNLWTYTFLIFLPFCVATFYYIVKMIPETRNKTFLEIRAILTTKQATIQMN